MAIVAHATHKQMNFTVSTDFFFVLAALCVNIRRVAIQQVDVFSRDINVVKEITVHKAMVAFRMLLRQANVFIHVEGHHVLEADLARFVHLNQSFIRSKRRASGRQTEYERTIGGRFERVDTVYDVACSPFTDLFCCSQGDQSHYSPLSLKIKSWRIERLGTI